MDSLSPLLKCEFDSDYFVARRLQREEEALRLQEEENNLLALTKLLMEEENEEKKRKQEQLEDSQAAMELYRQLNKEQAVDYNSLLLQRQKEEEESFKLAQQLQAYEEERERQEREKQEYEDMRFAAKMMLMEEEQFRTTTPMETAVRPSVHYDNEDGDHTYAVQVEKQKRMGIIVTQMYQEHARFERISKRKSNESMNTNTTEATEESIDLNE